MSELLWRCEECGWTGTNSEIDRVADPKPGSTMDWSVCPACRAAEAFENICDEPGCKSVAGCGWSSPAGYRRTCWAHATGMHTNRRHEPAGPQRASEVDSFRAGVREGHAQAAEWAKTFGAPTPAPDYRKAVNSLNELTDADLKGGDAHAREQFAEHKASPGVTAGASAPASGLAERLEMRAKGVSNNPRLHASYAAQDLRTAAAEIRRLTEALQECEQVIPLYAKEKARAEQLERERDEAHAEILEARTQIGYDNRLISDSNATIAASEARFKALEAENFALAANQCHAGYAGEKGDHRCREVDAAYLRGFNAVTEHKDVMHVRNLKIRNYRMTDDELRSATTPPTPYDAAVEIRRLTEARDELDHMKANAQGFCRDAKHAESVADEWKRQFEKEHERAEKFMRQVRDTCTRAEQAEAYCYEYLAIAESRIAQINEANARAEQLERERDEAIRRGWKAAHDCIAYCVANWQQDARTEKQQASLTVIGEYLADMRRESPDEYLAIEWRGVEALAASEERVKVLEDFQHAVMDYVERHWKGAGVKPSAEWVTRELADRYQSIEHERDDLEKRVKVLEEALKPFVAHYEPWVERQLDKDWMHVYPIYTMGDLRRARAALKREGE